MDTDGYYEDYKDESTHTCSECGKEYTWQWTTKHVGLCFTCKHWYDWMVRSMGNPNMYVVKHTAYTDVPVREGERGGGHGGSLFVIIKLNTGETIESRNMWCQGDIPKHWHRALPDTAEFRWHGTHRCAIKGETNGKA